MELIRGLHNIQGQHQGCVATIGNFDGLHLGHQQIIDSVSTIAAELDVASCVISFEPLPIEYFAPQKAPPRLTHLREKCRALEQHNVGQLLLLGFNHKLANTNASDFITNVLVEGLRVRHLLIGDDFRFGRNREGDLDLLLRASKQYGFTLQQASTLSVEGSRVSSTRIRNLLESGDLASAARLLGKHYALQGRVEPGAQLGRTIGFPTANIALQSDNPPLRGVFVVEVELGDTLETTPGIANIGAKPTVDGKRVTLEVHLLDFTGDLYGQRLRVKFLHKIRSEKKFDALDELKQAIATDETTARQWIKDNR